MHKEKERAEFIVDDMVAITRKRLSGGATAVNNTIVLIDRDGEALMGNAILWTDDRGKQILLDHFRQLIAADERVTYCAFMLRCAMRQLDGEDVTTTDVVAFIVTSRSGEHATRLFKWNDKDSTLGDRVTDIDTASVVSGEFMEMFPRQTRH